MSIVICPKCNQRNYICGGNFNCFNCSFWERSSIVAEEDIDHKESRKAKEEVKEKDLKFWMREQKKLCKRIIKDCLPEENYKVSFFKGDWKLWGWTEYYENDINKAKKAEKKWWKFKEEGKNYEAWWLNNYGAGGLVRYSSKTSKINIAPQTLKTKYSTNTLYGPRGAGFLPTSTHEAAHASYQVVHHQSFQPWIRDGHDLVWKKTATKFHDEMKIKYGAEVDQRFRELEEIEGNNKDYFFLLH